RMWSRAWRSPRLEWALYIPSLIGNCDRSRSSLAWLLLMGGRELSRCKKCAGKKCDQVLAHHVCMARAAVITIIDDAEADFVPRVLSQVCCSLQFFEQPRLVGYADHSVSVTMNDPYMRIDLAKHTV